MQELILLHIEMWQDNVSLSREEKKLDYIGIKSDHLATMVVFLSKFKENKIPSSERLNGLYKTGIFHTAFSARLSCPHSLCFSLSQPKRGIGHMAKHPLTPVCSPAHPPSPLSSNSTHTHAYREESGVNRRDAAGPCTIGHSRVGDQSRCLSLSLHPSLPPTLPAVCGVNPCQGTSLGAMVLHND